MDPMENINNAADALRQVAERGGSFWDVADDQIAERRGAYDALANNLEGIVRGLAIFTGYVDPAAMDLSGGDGGNFATLQELVAAAPDSSIIYARLLAGETYLMNDSFSLIGSQLHISKTGNGDDPIINVTGVATLSGTTELNGIKCNFGAGVTISDVTINMPQGLVDNLPHSLNCTFIHFLAGRTTSLALQGCIVTGGAGYGLMSPHGGATAHLSMRDVTLDGGLNALVSCANGVSVISQSVVTFQNGATLTDGGTIGVNILSN